jgi:hypothetical protein
METKHNAKELEMKPTNKKNNDMPGEAAMKCSRRERHRLETYYTNTLNYVVYTAFLLAKELVERLEAKGKPQ